MVKICCAQCCYIPSEQVRGEFSFASEEIEFKYLSQHSASYIRKHFHPPKTA